jgi:hypothetical protein
MVRDVEAVTATLLACRPELGSQDTADLLSDISATFCDYVEMMKGSEQIDPAQNVDRHRPSGSDDTLLKADHFFQHPVPASRKGSSHNAWEGSFLIVIPISSARNCLSY